MKTRMKTKAMRRVKMRYKIANIDNENSEGIVYISDEPEMCESCGGGAVHPFEPYYDDDNTSYCISCATCSGDKISDLELEQLQPIFQKVAELRSKFVSELSKEIKKEILMFQSLSPKK